MIRYFLVALFMCFAVSKGWAFERSNLRTGDVILTPLSCYLCKTIESETGANFSHSGIIVVEDENIFVLEALSGVMKITLKDFLSRTPNKGEVRVYRSKELERRFRNVFFYKNINASFNNLFAKNYAGLQFDPNFLWDNFDEQGRELLYCSEFVAKFLNNFLTRKIVTKPMSFKENWDYWLKYFGGSIPEGKPGLAPKDFAHSKLFKLVSKTIIIK